MTQKASWGARHCHDMHDHTGQAFLPMCANCMDWSVGVVSHKTLMSLALIARQSLSETGKAPPDAM
jgi:hypothetical protein